MCVMLVNEWRGNSIFFFLAILPFFFSGVVDDDRRMLFFFMCVDAALLGISIPAAPYRVVSM